MIPRGNVPSINPFRGNVPYIYPLKTSENQRFLIFSGGMKSEHWPEMGQQPIELRSQKNEDVNGNSD